MAKKEEKGLIKTSPQMTSTKAHGFSLIEMLVVVAIIVMITMVAMPSVSSYFQMSLNSATRDLATTVKEAYSATIVTGRVHRLVYDLKNHAFWVESGPPGVLLHTQETRQKEERRKRQARRSETENAPPPEFQLETNITRKKKDLPRGIIYEDVVTQESASPLTDGIAYTHFFPHGITEQTIIHLKDTSNHHASLIITPILGSTDLYDRYVTGAEVFAQ